MPSSLFPKTDMQDGVFKTVQCKFFSSGSCTRGEACTFAHGNIEIRKKPNYTYTRPCFNIILTGACEKGSQCKFAHSQEQLDRATHAALTDALVCSMSPSSQAAVQMPSTEISATSLSRYPTQRPFLQFLSSPSSGMDMERQKKQQLSLGMLEVGMAQTQAQSTSQTFQIQNLREPEEFVVLGRIEL
eukprot:TRINITY_DN2653_c1_g1_i1.p1 TRINITY_DN2653_c1_g1~~TRINITY_DN2653_c1_g1_i1.p1  ORF type:complete len:187 (+),score=23.14 TRINITY_DN2653_c1_g1_i1:103-663(+)